MNQKKKNKQKKPICSGLPRNENLSLTVKDQTQYSCKQNS